MKNCKEYVLFLTIGVNNHMYLSTISVIEIQLI